LLGLILVIAIHLCLLPVFSPSLVCEKYSKLFHVGYATCCLGKGRLREETKGCSMLPWDKRSR